MQIEGHPGKQEYEHDQHPAVRRQPGTAAPPAPGLRLQRVLDRMLRVEMALLLLLLPPPLPLPLLLPVLLRLPCRCRWPAGSRVQ